MKSIRRNGMIEKTREQGTIQQQPHKEEDAEDAEVQDVQQNEDKCIVIVIVIV